MRQKITELHGLAAADNHLSAIKVGPIKLVHELPAPTARRKNFSVARHSYDFSNAMFAACHHGRDRAVLGAEPDPRHGVDADPYVQTALAGKQSTADVTDV